MVRNEDAKVAVLVVAVVTLALLCLPMERRLAMGVSSVEGGLWSRLAYSWLHVGWVHALLNVWCLLTLVFLFGCSSGRMCWAYVSACAIPAFMLSDIPAVGLSGVCWFLMGSLSFEVRRKWVWQLWMWFFIMAGLLVPGVSFGIHLWCYVCGMFYGSLLWLFGRTKAFEK